MQRTAATLILAACLATEACDRLAVTRVTARPAPPTMPLEPGVHRLGLGTTRYRGLLRDGFLYVPRAAQSRAVPLVVMLHAGGGRADEFTYLYPIVEDYGVAALTLDARDNTWDAIDSLWGRDVVFIDKALRHTFERVAIDTGRIAIAGVSDGGFYALSLGIGNGDLFTHVIAVAPGYFAPPQVVGRPRIYLAHGTRDNVYDVRFSRIRVLPRLKETGYNVTYDEFDGPHTMPPAVARRALDWLVR